MSAPHVIELTPAQRQAVECEAPCLQIAACAGSGKTEVLARRVAAMLARGVAPDSIVAFTFTEKAAEELKRRIDDRAAQQQSTQQAAQQTAQGAAQRANRQANQQAASQAAQPEPDARRPAALPPSSSGLFAGTIHSFCLDLLRKSGAYELHDVLTEERQWALLHRFARRLGLVDLYKATWPGSQVSVRRAVDVFLDNLSAVCSEAIPTDALRGVAPGFAAAVERYERLTEAMQLLSFDQIILKAVDGLRPGGPLRPLLEGRVREVLVDEYQDLNRAQEALLKCLRELGANLTVVGDDDQAIYQWRGGDVSLFVGFPARHGGVAVTLAENHRSAPSIVRVSGAFAETIDTRVAKTMVPSRPDCGPRVELVAARDPDDEAASIVRRIRSLLTHGHRPGDIAVLYRSVRTSAEPLAHALREAGIPAAIAGRVSLLDRPEMRLVARVFVLWAGGTWRPNQVEEWVRPEDLVDEIVSVAGRSREEAAGAVLRLQEMGRELAAHGVADLVRTYMEVLSVLGLPCGSGADRARQERALGSMSALLVDFEHSMKRAAPPPGSGLEWLNAIHLDAEGEVAEERAVAEAYEAGTAAVTAEVAAREALAAGASGASAPGAGGAQTQAGLPQLGPGWGIASFGGRLVPGEVLLARLKVFLERFASQAVEETAEGVEPDAGAVNIMTVHQAKGLEFPVVFVPCLVDGRFPSSRTGQKKRWYIPDRPDAASTASLSGLFDKERYEGRLADERRLFYVALTRARELLVLSCFSEHKGRKTCPSQFLRELVSGGTVKGELRRLGAVSVLAAVGEAEATAAGAGAPAGGAREDGLVVDCGQLLVYSECPRKYYLRYVCGFAPPIAPALGFGKVAHHVVCEMARRARPGATPSASEAAAVLQECFYLPFAGRTQREAMLDAL
ncbi:MAG: UvrD-helicase domain-containing protein, partial [Clostridia bacterium]